MPRTRNPAQHAHASEYGDFAYLSAETPLAQAFLPGWFTSSKPEPSSRASALFTVSTPLLRTTAMSLRTSGGTDGSSAQRTVDPKVAEQICPWQGPSGKRRAQVQSTKADTDVGVEETLGLRKSKPLDAQTRGGQHSDRRLPGRVGPGEGQPIGWGNFEQATCFPIAERTARPAHLAEFGAAHGAREDTLSGTQKKKLRETLEVYVFFWPPYGQRSAAGRGLPTSIYNFE
ncbi:hypothetical protein V8E36_007654 [Tilletia maclaganii]